MLPEEKAVCSNPCCSSHPPHPEDAGKAGTHPQGSCKARVKKGHCGCTTLVTKPGRCIFLKKQKNLLFLGLVWDLCVPNVLLPFGASVKFSSCTWDFTAHLTVWSTNGRAISHGTKCLMSHTRNRWPWSGTNLNIKSLLHLTHVSPIICNRYDEIVILFIQSFKCWYAFYIRRTI